MVIGNPKSETDYVNYGRVIRRKYPGGMSRPQRHSRLQGARRSERRGMSTSMTTTSSALAWLQPDDWQPALGAGLESKSAGPGSLGIRPGNRLLPRRGSR